MAEIGKLLDGKYEILTEIGRGGMSTVYLAMDRRLNHQWAVKEVKKSARDANNELIVTSLQAEANLMKALDHPRIPRIVDIIEDPETIYIVMDYMPGKSLDKILTEQQAPIPQPAVIQIGIQLCDALGYLHAQNPPIIYRDMKPANVMLKNPDNSDPEKISVMLFDFGIAREYKENKIGDTKLMGTPGFASPEQYRREKQTDARSDIYSLGVTLYNLITGHSPATDNQMYPIRHWNPTLSGGLEKIILKCTQAEPEDRYQNCEELRAALENYEVYDDAYRKAQKTRLWIFLTAAILSMVYLFGGICFRVLYSNEKSSGYNELVLAGNDAADNYSALIERGEDGTDAFDQAYYDYQQAIEAEPSQPSAYEGLIDLFKADGTLTSDEDKLLRKEITSANLLEVRRKSAQDYMDLCYEVGRMYWFYYDQSTDSVSGIKNARRWFENVHDVYESDNVAFSNRDLNEVFLSIAQFYDDINQSIQEGDTYDFVGLFENLQQLMGYIENNTIDQELMQWQSCEVVMNILGNYMQKFCNAGVPQADVTALAQSVQEQADRLEVTIDKTEELRNYIEENLPAVIAKIQSNYGT